MGYDGVVFGTLRFPAGRLRVWKNLACSDVFHDWPPSEVRSLGDFGPTPVGTMLATVVDQTDGAFDLVEDDTTVRVRAVLANESYGECCRKIATCLRLAAEVGAEGDVRFVRDAPGAVAMLLRVGGGSSTVQYVDDDGVEQDAVFAWYLDRVLAKHPSWIPNATLVFHGTPHRRPVTAWRCVSETLWFSSALRQTQKI